MYSFSICLSLRSKSAMRSSPLLSNWNPKMPAPFCPLTFRESVALHAEGDAFLAGFHLHRLAELFEVLADILELHLRQLAVTL